MSFKSKLKFNTEYKKSFYPFLVSQGLANMGDTFQFIAVTALLIKVTGSGLSAGFSIICTPIASLLLSSFAGSLGDRFNAKYLLILLDSLRGLIVVFLMGCHRVEIIYILILMRSSLEILSNPPRKKLLVNILDEKKIIIGNSLLSGISGITFIIGPTIAGLMIEQFGMDTAFLINGLCFFISSAVLLFTRVHFYSSKSSMLKKAVCSDLLQDTLRGFRYCRHVGPVRELIILGTVVCLGTASINMTFYPFAFDVLGVSSKGWGMMMSIFYGTNLAAMFISIWLNKKASNAKLFFIGFSLVIVSAVWLLYGTTANLLTIILLQALEGTCLSLFTILLNTELQLNTDNEFLARVMGTNDILNNIGKLIGIGCTSLILHFISIRSVFIINGILLAAFLLTRLHTLQTSMFIKKSYS